MKIRLAILENDSNYLNRIVNVFTTRFTDRLEVYSFTSEDQALGTVQSGRIDVFLADEAFNIAPASVPKGCGFGYLVETSGIDMFRDQTAVCKYQKPDLIYRQILSLFSEQSGNAVVLSQADESCRVVTFTSPAGGCGCSTVAAAYAIHEARKGRRTMYLNLEKYGSSDVFFSAEGQFTMTDLIFALKSRKSNLALKLERHYGTRPVLYVTRRSYRLYIKDSEFEDYPLWIRDVYKPVISPDNWVFWQYADDGELDGYNGEEDKIDLNAFNGTKEELDALCGVALDN